MTTSAGAHSGWKINQIIEPNVEPQVAKLTTMYDSRRKPAPTKGRSAMRKRRVSSPGVLELPVDVLTIAAPRAGGA